MRISNGKGGEVLLCCAHYLFGSVRVMVCKWSVLCVDAQSDDLEEHGPELRRSNSFVIGIETIAYKCSLKTAALCVSGPRRQ